MEGSSSHYLQGFIHPTWLFGISSDNRMWFFRVFFGGDGLIQTESIISKSQLDTNEDAPRPLNQTITTPTINSSPKRVEQNGIHKKVVRTRQKSTKSTYLHLPLGVFFISAYNTANTTSLRFLTAPFGRCCWLWSKDDS